VTVPLLLEYEAALSRDLAVNSAEWRVRMDLLDYLCTVAARQEVFFLWRPFLRDPKDEMVLEAAVAGGCSALITYNTRDFAGAEQFDLSIYTPKEFLEIIGALP